MGSKKLVPQQHGYNDLSFCLCNLQASHTVYNVQSSFIEFTGIIGRKRVPNECVTSRFIGVCKCAVSNNKSSGGIWTWQEVIKLPLRRAAHLGTPIMHLRSFTAKVNTQARYFFPFWDNVSIHDESLCIGIWHFPLYSLTSCNSPVNPKDISVWILISPLVGTGGGTAMRPVKHFTMTHAVDRSCLCAALRCCQTTSRAHTGHKKMFLFQSAPRRTQSHSTQNARYQHLFWDTTAVSVCTAQIAASLWLPHFYTACSWNMYSHTLGSKVNSQNQNNCTGPLQITAAKPPAFSCQTLFIRVAWIIYYEGVRQTQLRFTTVSISVTYLKPFMSIDWQMKMGTFNGKYPAAESGFCLNQTPTFHTTTRWT